MNIQSLSVPRTGSLLSATLVLLLTGCATFSPDGGFGTVETVAKDRLGKDAKWLKSDQDGDTVDSLVKQRLAKSLDVDDAVQIALLNNRGLQAIYAELGIAEADLVRAGRLQNPGFLFRRTRQGGDTLIERTFTANLIQWLTAPLVGRIEGRRFEGTQLLVANEALRVAAETSKAYVDTVAAQQSVEYLGQVKDAAESSADLANRMVRAGNWSKLDQAREQVFYADATAQLARARQVAVGSREKLTRLMGLWGEDARFKLPDRLPDLPKDPLVLSDMEKMALRDRLDVQAAKLEAAGLASSLGLTRTTRFVNVLDLGYIRNSQTGQPRETGYEIGVEIPLFDWGSARVAKAEAIYMQAVNRVAEKAVNARSEVREAYQDYMTAYDLAKHYRDEIVPLRKKISDENQLRYNGMLISVFELLADAREQVTAVNAYIQALRDFWMAQTELQAALGGKLPATPASMNTPALPGPQDSMKGQHHE